MSTLHILSKSILSIFLITSISSAMANKGKSSSSKNKTNINRIQEAKKQDSQRESKVNNEINALLNGLSVKNVHQVISLKEAEQIVKALKLNKKLSKSKQQELERVIANNPVIGSNMKLVSQNVTGVSKEVIHIIVQFAISVKSVTAVKVNQSLPRYENTAITLIQNMADAMNWKSSQRDSFMSLLKEITTNRNNGMHISGAINLALKNRGYDNVAKVIKRQKEIRENCQKTA